MRKIQHFNKTVSEDLNFSAELVSAVNKWYWSQGVRKNLSQANHRSLFITGLGTIIISRYKIREEISYLIDRIRKLESDPFLKKTNILSDMRANLSQLCKRRNEIAKDYVAAFGVHVRMRKLTLKDYLKNHE